MPGDSIDAKASSETRVCWVEVLFYKRNTIPSSGRILHIASMNFPLLCVGSNRVRCTVITIF